MTSLRISSISVKQVLFGFSLLMLSVMQARKIDFKAGVSRRKNERRGMVYGKADKVGGIS
jgi:hypothetical protein